MTDRIAVGDFLVLVRVDEEPGPRPTEDGLQIRLAMRPLGVGQPAVEKAAVIIRGRRDVERAFLAALDFEAGNAARSQGRQMIGQRKVLHRKRKAVSRITVNVAAVAESEWSAGDLEIVAARIRAFAAIAAAA